jgi:hypothetical protein
MGEDTRVDFTVVALGFDDADVRVNGAGAGGNGDGADIPRDSSTTAKPAVKEK